MGGANHSNVRRGNRRSDAKDRRQTGYFRISASGRRERLARLELLELLDELDAKHGAPTPDVVADVDREAERIFGRRPAPRKRP